MAITVHGQDCDAILEMRVKVVESTKMDPIRKEILHFQAVQKCKFSKLHKKVQSQVRTHTVGWEPETQLFFGGGGPYNIIDFHCISLIWFDSLHLSQHLNSYEVVETVSSPNYIFFPEQAWLSS